MKHPLRRKQEMNKIKMAIITGMSYNDMVMLAALAILLIVVLIFINQGYRYQKLKEDLENYLNELNNQDRAIKRLEDDLREYMMGSKGLKDWSRMRQQMVELSDLPSFTETEKEYILKTYISRIKKDNVKVSGMNNGIKVSIESEEGIPFQAFYSTPKNIDPWKLKVNYTGGILEVRAPKSIMKTEEKDEE